MKKPIKYILIGLGSVFILFILMIASAAIISDAKRRKYNKTAVPYVKEIASLVAEWDHEKFEDEWAPEVFEKLKKEDLEKLFTAFSVLGTLKEFNDPVFLGWSSSTGNPYGSFIQYSVKAEFEKGPGVFYFTLVPVDKNEFKTWYLRLNSDVFVDTMNDAARNDNKAVEEELLPAPRS